MLFKNFPIIYRSAIFHFQSTPFDGKQMNFPLTIIKFNLNFNQRTHWLFTLDLLKIERYLTVGQGNTVIFRPVRYSEFERQIRLASDGFLDY